MENIVSDEYVFFIDREGKTDIIPVPAEFCIFVVFFLAVFLKSRIGCYLDQLRYCSGGVCLSFRLFKVRVYTGSGYADTLDEKIPRLILNEMVTGAESYVKNRLIKEQNRLLKVVKRRIAELGKWVKENQSVNPFHSVPIHSQQPPTLLELLNTAMQQAGQPNSRYGKIKDLKSFAKAVSFLQGNDISTLSELQETLSGMKKRYWNTNSEIKQTEKLPHERKELIDQAEKYLLYRDYHKTYKQTKPKKQEEYAERYRTELALYDRAERYLKEHLGSDTKLRPKAWKAEVADLTAQKDRLYSEVRKLKEEVAEAETVKRCIEQAIPPTEQRKEKSKTQDISL